MLKLAFYTSNRPHLLEDGSSTIHVNSDTPGGRRTTGGITKTGNSTVRRLLVECAWTYRFPLRQTHHLQRKSRDASDYAKTRAWDAQERLCDRYTTMVRNGKNTKSIITAIARELVGFIGDIARYELTHLDPSLTG